MRLSFTFFLSLIALAVCDTFSCGGTVYSSKKLTTATGEACSLLKQGRSVGRNKYPHEYRNLEKIKLTGSGPYYEFPIFANGEVYDGGEFLHFPPVCNPAHPMEGHGDNYIWLTASRFSWTRSSHYYQGLQASRRHHSQGGQWK